MPLASSSSPLLDLPTELLHTVYDALEIEDRVRLNAAIPRERTITRTSRTDATRDRKLGVIARFAKRRALKMRPLKLRDLSGRLLSFVGENATDPTIARCFPDCCALREKNAAARLLRAIVAGDVDAILKTPPLAAQGDTTEVNRDDVEELKAAVYRSSPAAFDAVVARRDALLGTELLESQYTLFHAINWVNEPLVEHLVAQATTVAGIHAGIAYVVTPETAKILSMRTGCVRILLRHLGDQLGEAARAAMIHDAMKWMNVDVADMLMAEND